MPQKSCERWFCHVIAFAYYLKCPKIEEIHFRFFFDPFEGFLYEIPDIFMSEIFEMFHFYYFQNQIGKMGNSNKRHVSNFKTENET